MSDTKFTKEYFIKKFEAIPEHRWTVGILKEIINIDTCLDYKCCALGHCGVKMYEVPTKEAEALSKLFGSDKSELREIWDWEDFVISINDDKYNVKGFGTTPKQRIINKLKSL